MAKKTAPVASPVKAGTASFRIADGVTHINGQKVSGDTVHLTAEQALYDVAVGRLTPIAGELRSGESA